MRIILLFLAEFQIPVYVIRHNDVLIVVSFAKSERYLFILLCMQSEALHIMRYFEIVYNVHFTALHFPWVFLYTDTEVFKTVLDIFHSFQSFEASVLGIEGEVYKIINL